jgi:hypothetical protein
MRTVSMNFLSCPSRARGSFSCAGAVLCILMSGSVRSAEAEFGVITRAQGTITVQAATGERRRVGAGEVLRVGDRVDTDQDGQALVSGEDGSLVAVRPSTAWTIEAFGAENRTPERYWLSLTRGSLRIVTGLIGRLNPGGYRINTPEAFIGIRGTDHEPYVIENSRAAALRAYKGTYDRVHRGATTLTNNAGTVNVPAGRAAVAPVASGADDAGATGADGAPKAKALMTLALPRLLEAIPSFYLRGAFDDHIDATADEAMAPTGCPALRLAADWLLRLDRAIAARDADTVLSMFAPHARVGLKVPNGSGAAIEMDRETFARSTLQALASLDLYAAERRSLDAMPTDDEEGRACRRIRMSSALREQTRQAGQSFSFELTEHYLLEAAVGGWQAVTAQSY